MIQFMRPNINSHACFKIPQNPNKFRAFYRKVLYHITEILIAVQMS